MFTTEQEQTFFLSRIKSNHVVLEYGSGQSTLDIEKIAAKIISIEHDEHWYHQMSKQVSDKCKLIYVPPNMTYKEGGCDGTFEQFENYINEPSKHGVFDVVLIDGRARLECVKNIRKVCHADTQIFVHDFFSRLKIDNYENMYDYLDQIDSIGDMCLFKMKEYIQ